MCDARRASSRRRRIILISSATANTSNNNHKIYQESRSAIALKLPRCGNSSHHQFTASSSSSSAAAAGALRRRQEDDDGHSHEKRMVLTAVTTRAAKNTGGSTVVTSTRRHSLPSNSDSCIPRSRSHHVNAVTLLSRRHSSHAGAIYHEEDNDDDEPSGARTPELPIPAPTNSQNTNGQTGGRVDHDDGTDVIRGNVDEGELTRMYDFATWNMYERIVSARRQRLVTSKSTTTESTSTSTITSSLAHHQNNIAARGAEGEENAVRDQFKPSTNNAVGSAMFLSSSTNVAAADAPKAANTTVDISTSTSKPSQLYCKTSSTITDATTDSESSTLATADETDKSSTASSSWSRTDSPGFPAAGGGIGNVAFLNPLRSSVRSSSGSNNPKFCVSYPHPTMFSNMGSNSVDTGGVVMGSARTTTPTRHEDDSFMFQLEM